MATTLHQAFVLTRFAMMNQLWWVKLWYNLHSVFYHFVFCNYQIGLMHFFNLVHESALSFLAPMSFIRYFLPLFHMLRILQDDKRLHDYNVPEVVEAFLFEVHRQVIVLLLLILHGAVVESTNQFGTSQIEHTYAWICIPLSVWGGFRCFLIVLTALSFE